MTERWRKPVKLVGIESSTGTMTIGDRQYRDYEYILDRESWERIRSGYMCIQCFEPHERPFPPVCPLCGTTAEEHRQRIPMEDAGETWVGPRESYEDEEARLQEENARRMHKPQSSIWLPDTKGT